MRGQRGYVVFRDDTRIDYDPPRNTMDPRYAACKSHRVACDCREGEYQEEIHEYRSEYEAMRKAIGEVLAGHQADLCSCTGCKIARLVGLTHVPLLARVADEEVPF